MRRRQLREGKRALPVAQACAALQPARGRREVERDTFALAVRVAYRPDAADVAERRRTVEPR